MEAAAGLLVVLLGVCYGVETHCDGRQNGAQCYGALGGTVDIQLMDSSSEIPRYELFKNFLKILDVKNNKVISNTIKHSSVFPSNGTFRINNLSRNDGGKFTLQTFDSDGRTSGEQTLQLFIQAAVSSVLLVSECLSQGEMRVSCSSEGGDSPQYSWTLDGRTLTDAELLSGNNEGNNITLKQHISGHLVCSVRNNVSDVSKGERISTCAGILPLIGGVLLALIILLVMGLAVICAQRIKQSYTTTKPKGQNQRDHLAVYRRNDSQYEEEDEHVEHIVGLEVETEEEVEPELEVETEVEPEVEVKPEVAYSQVFKFSKRPQQIDPRGIECLYAKVHKIR